MNLKRTLALLLATASVLALSACHVKKAEEIPQDPAAYEEYSMSVALSEAAASSAAEVSVAAEVSQYVKKNIGDTQKNKQVVFMRTEGDYLTEYRVFEMDRKGVCTQVMIYDFFDTVHYNLIKSYGDRENDKLVKHDDDIRLLVYKNNSQQGLSMRGLTYEEIYAAYDSNDIWTRVE